MQVIPVKIITAPSFLPLTLGELKDHLNIPAAVTEFDSLLTLKLQSAVDYCQGFTGIYLMKQVAEVYADDWAVFFNFYGISPVISVDSVKYRDAAGDWQTLNSSEYKADIISPIPRVKLVGDLPSLEDDAFNRVKFTLTLGFSDDSDESVQQAAVPARLKQGILLRAGRDFTTREDKDVKLECTAADAAFWPFKTFTQ